jgi:hypothetical protein
MTTTLRHTQIVTATSARTANQANRPGSIRLVLSLVEGRLLAPPQLTRGIDAG